MGFIKIWNISKNNSTKLSHQTLFDLDSDEKKNLLKSIYGQYYHNRIKLFCCCKYDAVDMKISYVEKSDSYYLSSFPKKAGEHELNCYFHNGNTISSSSTYQKNIEEDNEGNFHVNLLAHDYQSKEKTTSTKTGTSTIVGEDGPSINKLTTNHLIKLIVTKAWNDYIYWKGKDKFPTIQIIFKQIFNHTTKKFFIKKTSINNLLFIGKNINQLYYLKKNNKFHAFTLLLLKKVIQNDTNYHLVVVSPLAKVELKIAIDRNIWEEAKRTTNVSTGPYIVGGFINYIGYGTPPEFVSIGILPINKWGVPIESSYERTFYDLICTHKRLVQRPSILDKKYYPDWKGLIPDGLFIDTKFHTLIEVFGRSESDIQYHEHKRYKIDLYSKLQEKWGLWSWDAYNDSEIPTLPKSIFSENP